jgi:hypothetical protein
MISRIKSPARGILIYFALLASHLIAFLLGFVTMYGVALRVVKEMI